MSFNTQPNEFYTILINGEQEWQFLFQEHSDAEKWIQERASWDCRPQGGDYSEWYDPRSGTTYKIVEWEDGRISVGGHRHMKNEVVTDE